MRFFNRFNENIFFTPTESMVFQKFSDLFSDFFLILFLIFFRYITGILNA